jgi:hypothetical protein
MRTILFILFLSLAVLLPGKELKAQVVDIKSWHGTYPNMDGSYPLSFVAFKGWLIPVPHVFIRTWPTHYYIEVDALPVSDGTTYSDLLRINLMKIVERLIEKSQMEKRREETEQIKSNTLSQRDIEKEIFDANSDQLPDVYNIASGFVRLYLSIERLKQTCQKEADQLLSRFVSINLFQTDHGKKLEAFDEIRKELDHQIGETDYCYRKVHHYQFYANNVSQSYNFLKE